MSHIIDYSPDATLTMAAHAEVYGHSVWHWTIETDIGVVHIVQYEGAHMQIFTDVFFGNAAKAGKLFEKRVKDLLAGKGL